MVFRRALLCGCAMAWLCAVAVAQPRTVWWLDPPVLRVPVGATGELSVVIDAGDSIAAASSYRALQAELVWDAAVAGAAVLTRSGRGYWKPPPAGCADVNQVIQLTRLEPPGYALLGTLSLFANPQCQIQRDPFPLWTLGFEGRAPGTTQVVFHKYTRLLLETIPEQKLDLDFDALPATVVVYEPFVWGDVTGDGQSTALDAAMVLRWDAFLIASFPVAPGTIAPAFPPGADVNGDGLLSALDAAFILHCDAFLIDCYRAVDLNCDFQGPDWE